MSLDGTNFFYPNALESDGVYTSNRGSCTRQSWFDCSCCPTNLIRFIPSIPGLIYSKTNTEIYVNLYASKVNGELVSANEHNGYFTIKRNWKKNDAIEINFPMEVKEVVTNRYVAENKEKIALEYGPIVYAIEEIDNKDNFDTISVNMHDSFNVKKEGNLLDGVNTIQNKSLKAIPYYAWSNRGVGKMKVWIANNKIK